MSQTYNITNKNQLDVKVQLPKIIKQCRKEVSAHSNHIDLKKTVNRLLDICIIQQDEIEALRRKIYPPIVKQKFIKCRTCPRQAGVAGARCKRCIREAKAKREKREKHNKEFLGI